MTEEPCDGITPSLLPELEELTLCSEYSYDDPEQPDTLKLEVLGSLVCPKLRKIVITHTNPEIFDDDLAYNFDAGAWAKIDGFLVRLAERSNSRLRVELSDSYHRHFPMIDRLLPAFREVGDFASVPARL